MRAAPHSAALRPLWLAPVGNTVSASHVIAQVAAIWQNMAQMQAMGLLALQTQPGATRAPGL